jgi:hypothetical protein
MKSLMIPGTGALGQLRPNLVHINESAIKGEAGTGFEKAADLGEFECGNCEYFDATAGACDQDDMKEKSKQPRLSDGRVMVAAEDCCEYVERLGKKDKDGDHGEDK